MRLCTKVVMATSALFLILLVVGNSYASSSRALWEDFLNRPSEEAYSVLNQFLDQCVEGCDKGAFPLSVGMMKKFEGLIADANSQSVEIGLKIKKITKNDNQAIEFIDRGLAQAITKAPLDTLRIMHNDGVDETSLRDVVTLTSEASIDDVPLWRHELNERRRALKSVDDKTVSQLREIALQEIESALTEYSNLPDNAGGLCMGKPCRQR